MRIRKSQPPEVLRELAAVDAALAGNPVDPDLAEIERLAVALAAERPVPRKEFVEALDALVRTSFRAHEVGARAKREMPGERSARQREVSAAGRRLWRRASLVRRRAPLAFGVAASALIVVTAVLSSGVLSPGGDGGQTEERPAAPAFEEQSGKSRAREAAPGGVAEGAGVPGRAPGDAVVPSSPAPSTGIAPGAPARKIERQASLTLGAPRGEVEEVADGVIQVADRYRGFVLSSSVSGGGQSREGATLDLRIPSSRLQAAIADISRLAHVRSRTQSTLDVTAAHSSARSRLREASAERRALLRQLAGADTPNETASIRARLRLVNRRIARARTALRDIGNRVRYAAVGVTVEPARQRQDAGAWTPGEALDDAFGILGTSLAVALVSLAGLVPLSILALLAWIAGRRVVHERRERALDGAAGIENRPSR